MSQTIKNILYILFIKFEIVSLVLYWKGVQRFLLPDNFKTEFTLSGLFLMLSVVLVFILYVALAISFYKEQEIDLFS